MKQVVIVGGSAAGVAIVEALLPRGEFEFTFFLADDCLPYSRERIVDLVAPEGPADRGEIKPKSFFAQPAVRVIFQQTISRINFKRRKIFTEAKEQIDFDILILTEMTAPVWPQARGRNKTGVYHASRLSQARVLAEALPSVETIVIESEFLSDLALAAALSRRKKEVLLFVPSAGWTTALSEEHLKWLKSLLGNSGIRLWENEAIEEILGDTEVKAVRLKSAKKVLASQAVIFSTPFEDLRPIEQTELSLDTTVIVSGRMRASVENVFGLDRMIWPKGNLQSASFLTPDVLWQAQTVVQEISSDLALNPLSRPLSVFSFSIAETTFDMIGCLPAGLKPAEAIFDPIAGSLCLVFAVEGQVVGVCLINLRKDFDKFLRFVQQRVNLIEVRDQLT
ncbi:MAG: FAD-dependent oxidoreductase [Candidatus Omnitrophica bacterium]|nr:FAD-dependent oxidoreductase [Candidatus Omnitrophota bacterium]